MDALRETDLYAPVKAFLEGQGYEVKGEIGAADVVALRGAEPPVIVELKLGFSLALLRQGVARQAASDAVYLAVNAPRGRESGRALRGNLGLCRRLGLGLMTVRPADGLVAVLADPGRFVPRKQPRRRAALLREFAARRGDPSVGGGTRAGLVTAYRQDATACALWLSRHGRAKGAEVARGAGIARATRIMADNHYGWFLRVERGTYALSEAGLSKAAGMAPGEADARA